MTRYYDLNVRLGGEAEERGLSAAIQGCKQASVEPLVQFLHITLNNLCSLLIRPSPTHESGEWGCLSCGVGVYMHVNIVFLAINKRKM